MPSENKQLSKYRELDLIKSCALAILTENWNKGHWIKNAFEPKKKLFIISILDGYVNRKQRRQHELDEISREIGDSKQQIPPEKPLRYLEKIEKPKPRPATPTIDSPDDVIYLIKFSVWTNIYFQNCIRIQHEIKFECIFNVFFLFCFFFVFSVVASIKFKFCPHTFSKRF